MNFTTPFFFVVVVALLSLTGCKDELFVDTNEFNLRFSTDTVMFDTVFTTIGTTTKRFTVHNPNNGRIRLKSISLAKGSESNFSINVDGQLGPTVMDVEIDKKDSIYIFVEANIDPNRDEMVEKDSIVFDMGNSRGDVKIIAFGQDVNLINGQTLQTQTWTSQKPYLVYNYAIVNESQTLTIEAGTAIHFHYGASLIINGTLDVSGNVEQPVVFRSDRLEPFYKDKPGQWGAWIETENGSIYLLGGIHFTQKSTNNAINYAIIENAIIGIQMDSVPGSQNPGLRLSNTIIRHMNLAGIVAKTSSIESHNLVVNNCGMYALALLLGGNYWFNHATIANYTPYTSRSTPAVVINNYYTHNGQIVSFPLERCSFTNSIIHGRYGNSQPELGVDLTNGETGNYMFDHCILQTGNAFDTSNVAHFRRIKITNLGVGFKDIGKYDFDLDTLSPAKDAGLIDFGSLSPLDIKGRSRISDLKPDLGAYERNEK
jgi:hypothetical protein